MNRISKNILYRKCNHIWIKIIVNINIEIIQILAGIYNEA